MRFSFILLAGGISDRFKSNVPKQYHKIGGKTLIDIVIHKISQFNEIKKIIVIYNKKHKKYLKNLKLKNVKILKYLIKVVSARLLENSPPTRRVSPGSWPWPYRSSGPGKELRPGGRTRAGTRVLRTRPGSFWTSSRRGFAPRFEPRSGAVILKGRGGCEQSDESWSVKWRASRDVRERYENRIQKSNPKTQKESDQASLKVAHRVSA